MTALLPGRPVSASSVAHHVGVVMDLDAGPRSARLAEAVIVAGRMAGCAVTFADTRNTGAFDAVSCLATDGADGVLIVPAPGDEPVVTRLLRLGVPTVLVDRIAARTDVDQVGSENIQATGELVRHLAGLGHRRIGLVSGARGLATSEERTLGYRFGMGRARLAWDDDLVACGESTAAGGAAALGRLLDGDNPPSALMVADEAMLVGVYYEAHRLGLQIGSDLAVVGYGDVAWGQQVTPPVTTMAYPMAELGRAAMKLLLRRFADPERRPEAVRSAPRFVHGGSCGC
jgi:LacI family transcriptional regulator